MRLLPAAREGRASDRDSDRLWWRSCWRVRGSGDLGPLVAGLPSARPCWSSRAAYMDLDREVLGCDQGRGRQSWTEQEKRSRAPSRLQHHYAASRGTRAVSGAWATEDLFFHFQFSHLFLFAAGGRINSAITFAIWRRESPPRERLRLRTPPRPAAIIVLHPSPKCMQDHSQARHWTAYRLLFLPNGNTRK